MVFILSFSLFLLILPPLSPPTLLSNRYFRKDSNVSNRTTLAARLVDRAIRPLAPPPPLNIQIHVDELVMGGEDFSDVLAINATSTALIAAQNVDWDTPVAAVRVASIDGVMKANPSVQEMYVRRVCMSVSPPLKRTDQTKPDQTTRLPPRAGVWNARAV